MLLTPPSPVPHPTQVPFAVGSLGVYYNKALPGSSLALTCENLARIYRWSGSMQSPARGVSRFPATRGKRVLTC